MGNKVSYRLSDLISNNYEIIESSSDEINAFEEDIDTDVLSIKIIDKVWKKEKVFFNKSNPEGKFNLNTQRGFGSEHRSGWNYVMLKLAELHNDESSVYLDTFLENTFFWDKNEKLKSKEIPYDKYWVGFIHTTKFVPECHRKIGIKSIEDLFEDKEFQESLAFCKGLYTLSDYNKKHILKLLDGRSIPVNSLLHPTVLTNKVFRYRDFKNNSEKKIIQIGYARRRIQSIYDIKSNIYKKVRLVTNTPNYLKFEKVRIEEMSDSYSKHESDDNVIQLAHVSNDYYDQLLSRNIVFLHLYDASANNTVIECIVRHTPIVINRIPAAEEYLGKEYPLFYNDLSEVQDLIDNIENILKANTYLIELNKKGKLRGNYFLDEIQKSEIYKSL